MKASPPERISTAGRSIIGAMTGTTVIATKSSDQEPSRVRRVGCKHSLSLWCGSRSGKRNEEFVWIKATHILTLFIYILYLLRRL